MEPTSPKKANSDVCGSGIAVPKLTLSSISSCAPGDLQQYIRRAGFKQVTNFSLSPLTLLAATRDTLRLGWADGPAIFAKPTDFHIIESTLLRTFARVRLVSMRFATDSNCSRARTNKSDRIAMLCLPTPP